MKKIIIILSLLILIVGCAEQIDKTDNIKEVPKETEQIEEQTLIEPEQKEVEEAAPKSDEELPIVQEDVVEETDTPSNIICQKIPLTEQLSPSDRYYCFAAVNHNPEFCQKIEVDPGDEEEEANKNICLAVASEDSSYCKKMQDPLSKHVCYYQLAVISDNINFCDDIDYDKNERLQCYFTFVSNLYWWDKSNEIKTEYCNKFPTNEPDRNTCLAFKERDVSLCKNNINCLTFFKQDMSFCAGKGSTLKDCVRDRAMTSKDISICETLTGEKRDDCIGDFCTHIKLDTSICDKISDDMERQSRYVEVAINLASE